MAQITSFLLVLILIRVRPHVWLGSLGFGSVSTS